MQPQWAAYVAQTCQGDPPAAGFAQLYVEVAPANEVFSLVNAAVKNADVRSGLQVVRQAALDGDLRLPELCSVTAMLLERTAARTAKWEMPETVALLRRAASILGEWRPDTSREYAVVIEHLLMALNRIQAAVDAIIPWNDLDDAVRLRPGS